MNPTADIRDLLEHADWLRRLAGQLVGRTGEPDDLVQQTWLAAVRRPPAAHRPARPWLAEVLRNFARKSYRDRRARERREQTAELEAAAPTPPTADGLLEAAQLQRLLADLVLALDEPYRTTVLLRFYQGIEPTDIARDAGVPAGTVRWRVNEGVRRLRAALDGRAEARDWRRALAPFVAAGAPAASTLKGGLLIMSTKGKLVVGAVAVAALVIGAGVSATRSDGREEARPTTAVSSAAAAVVAEVEVEVEPRPAATGAALVRAGGGAPGASRAQPPAAPARARPARPAPPRLVAVPAGAGPAPEPPPPEIEGKLDKEGIRQGMIDIIPALKQCYDGLLEKQPKASGRLVFHFTITNDDDGDGRIADASIRPRTTDTEPPELIDPLTEQCMLNAVGQAKFPAPGSTSFEVTYPFNFTPGE